MNGIKDVLLPILKNIQGDNAAIKTDMHVLKENSTRMDMRLKAIESHMSGFMSPSRYLEIEVNELRGLEDAIKAK